MTKNWKKITAEKKFNFFWSKTTTNLSLGLQKNVQVKEEALSSQKRPSNISKHELLKFLTTFVGHFCPPGSGSTEPIEYGSNPDPDPQPC